MFRPAYLSRKLTSPLPTKDGGTLRTVGEACEYMAAIGKERELPARELIRELISWFIDDVVDDLGSRKDVEYAYKILEHGSSADRQIAVYDKTGDIKAVVDHLIAETREGVVPADEGSTGGMESDLKAGAVT